VAEAVVAADDARPGFANLSQGLGTLLDTGAGDITLRLAGGVTVAVHRCVVAARCPGLAARLSRDLASVTFDLDGVEPASFSRLLRCGCCAPGLYYEDGREKGSPSLCRASVAVVVRPWWFRLAHLSAT